MLRRTLPVLLLFGGAAVGSLTVLHVSAGVAAAVAVAVVACVTIAAALVSRGDPAWRR